MSLPDLNPADIANMAALPLDNRPGRIINSEVDASAEKDRASRASAGIRVAIVSPIRSTKSARNGLVCNPSPW